MANKVAPRQPATVRTIEYEVIPRFQIDFGYSMTQGEGPKINTDIVAIEFSVGETDADGGFITIRKNFQYYPEWPAEIRAAVRTLLTYAEGLAVAAGMMTQVGVEPDLPMSGNPNPRP